VDLLCDYTMTIYLPTNFGLGNSDTNTCKVSALEATSPTCTMDTTEKSITLGSFCDTTIAADTEMTFRVNKIKKKNWVAEQIKIKVFDNTATEVIAGNYTFYPVI